MLEPMLLKPCGKDYLWGGNRLKSEYSKQIDLTPLAETWECSVHPDGPSTVASGSYKGQLLVDVLKEHPEYLGTKGIKHGTLPILIKFIDAEKDLSVQVHPDDEYARIHENDNGKTEMWYVLDAKPGASLVSGFRHDITPKRLKEAVEKGDLMRYLNKTPVHKGDVFFIPPGTIHAIGAGILVAEIQESSNVTYRVYDYNRVDKNGKKRELHFDKAVKVLNLKAGDAIRQAPRKVDYTWGCSRETLCRCSYFETVRIVCSMGCAFSVMENSFQVVLCTDGEGGLTTDQMARPLRFKKGDCIFIPANTGRCHIIGKADLIKVRC